MSLAPKLISKSALNNAAKCPFMRSNALSKETLSNPNTVNTAAKICPFLIEQTQNNTNANIPEQPCELCSENISQVHNQVNVKAKVDYDHLFGQEISKIKSEGRYRIFRDLERKAGSFPHAKHHSATGVKDIIGWCSNDYLSMGQHPKVISAMQKAAETCGTGAGGTRNISGTNHFHVLLEQELADWHKKEAALIFSSCYVANETVLTSMSKILSNSIVFSDEHNHASMIQGIRYGTWEKKIYPHNDLNVLEKQLKDQNINRHKVIAFESVNSMEGTVAPVKDLCYLAKKYNALTFCDEVHAVGMYGYNGSGICARDNCQEEVDIISGTCGKALGVYGGYIASSANFVDAMRSTCPGFIFTTAIPPSVAAATLESVKILASDEGKKQRLKMHIAASELQRKFIERGIEVMETRSHITPLRIGDARKCKEISDVLLNEYGIYVQPINYPTVKKGTERLRITPLPVHDAQMRDHLVEVLDEVWSRFELPRVFREKNLDAFENKSEFSNAHLETGANEIYHKMPKRDLGSFQMPIAAVA